MWSKSNKKKVAVCLAVFFYVLQMLFVLCVRNIQQISLKKEKEKKPLTIS